MSEITYKEYCIATPFHIGEIQIQRALGLVLLYMARTYTLIVLTKMFLFFCDCPPLRFGEHPKFLILDV